MSSFFTRELNKVVENNLDHMCEHLSKELNIEHDQVKNAMNTFLHPKSGKITTTKSISTKSIPNNDKSLNEQIEKAKSKNKYYNVDTANYVSKNYYSTSKYTFYDELYIAGINGSEKLSNALAELNYKGGHITSDEKSTLPPHNLDLENKVSPKNEKERDYQESSKTQKNDDQELEDLLNDL